MKSGGKVYAKSKVFLCGGFLNRKFVDRPSADTKSDAGRKFKDRHSLNARSIDFIEFILDIKQSIAKFRRESGRVVGCRFH